MDLATGVARLARDDREGDVPAFAVLTLARCGEAGSVQQLPVRVVDEERVLAAVIDFDPLVVAGHRYDGAAAGERAAEHSVGRDGLHAGVDRAGALVLRPGRVQSPAGHLERAVGLALIVDELPHERGSCARGDAVDRLPLGCPVLACRQVGMKQPVAIAGGEIHSAEHCSQGSASVPDEARARDAPHGRCLLRESVARRSFEFYIAKLKLRGYRRAMSVDELSASAQNYLKAIWGLSEWSDEPVTLKLIAQRTGVALSSASDAVRKLTEQGLLSHARYGSVELTEVGRSYALVMVRRHRLIETFLVETLGYRWDEVHEEAEQLEHAVSDLMVERIDDVLGRPRRDPHGDPIPAADGTVTVPDARLLTDVGAEGRFVVERISDTDPAMLQFFESQGIGVGATLVVAAGAPFSDALEVRSGEVGSPTLLGRSATDALYVSAGPT